jgi:hypothetical protein
VAATASFLRRAWSGNAFADVRPCDALEHFEHYSQLVAAGQNDEAADALGRGLSYLALRLRHTADER